MNHDPTSSFHLKYCFFFFFLMSEDCLKFDLPNESLIRSLPSDENRRQCRLVFNESHLNMLVLF